MTAPFTGRTICIAGGWRGDWPAGLANVALYPASPASSYITGISITTDGGSTLSTRDMRSALEAQAQ